MRGGMGSSHGIRTLGSGGYGPGGLEGSWLWVDFSDHSTLFTDAARTTPVTADLQEIRGIADKSGFGQHFQAASDGVIVNGPIHTRNIQNGRAVGRLSGTHGLVSVANFPVFSQPYTIWGVVDNEGNDGTEGTWLRLGSTGPQMEHSSTGTYYFFAGTIQITSAPVNANKRLIIGVFDGASSSLDVDGTVDNVNPGAGGGGNAPGTIGFHAGPIRIWTGDLCELGMFPRRLSSGDIAQLKSYAKPKWATA